MAEALLAATLLAACSDGEADEPNSGLPDETTETSPTGTPTYEPTEAPPILPSDIDSTSPADAEAFARYVVEVFNYTKSTLDLEPLRAVFGPTCEVCKTAIKNLDGLAMEGARIKGGLWSVKYLRYVPDRPRESPIIDLVIKAADERVFHSGQAKPDVNEGYQSGYVWYLDFTETDGWQIADWQDGD